MTDISRIKEQVIAAVDKLAPQLLSDPVVVDQLRSSFVSAGSADGSQTK